LLGRNEGQYLGRIAWAKALDSAGVYGVDARRGTHPWRGEARER